GRLCVLKVLCSFLHQNTQYLVQFLCQKHFYRMSDTMDNVEIEGEKWGFPLKEIYRLALKFYKEKLGKAVYISYEDNLKLVAFTQQTTHGPLDPDKTPPIGVLDVIGRDRRLAWQQLGDIGRGQAMQGFIDLLDRLCPTFKPYAEAIRKDKEEKLKQAEQDQQLERERQALEQLQLEEQKRIDDEKNKAEQQKRQLQNVRVPTHEGGSCLFWEFATDSYDIGFGVYFEWGKTNTSEVSVHISESDDEDDLGEDEEDLDSSDIATVDDLESGPLQTIVPSSMQNKPPISIIVPIYRRDCQNEVYAGSHVYPGEGVYLLKFDNSYSLWRSKTLYYRVFYTR
uniref:ACB domain-containing protein n=1 Tax=Phlebotomus papatasi TaxID=29031 RepID=A0A1B0GQT0_PHLPP